MKSVPILLFILVLALPAGPCMAAVPAQAPAAKAPSPPASLDAELLAAASAGDSQAVRDLLKKGAQPTVFDGAGNTPLHLALANGHEKAAEILIKAGANVNAESREFGETPLFLAASLGLRDATRRLLDRGARVDARDRHLQTPLHMAVYQQNLEVVKILLDHDAKVNIGGGKNRITPLMVASAVGNVEIVNTLINHGAFVHARDDLGQTALYLASYAGSAEVVKILLDMGADVKPVTKTQGQDALMVAAAAGFTEIARMLLEKGAVYDLKDKTGTTALMYAGANRCTEIVNLMLSRQSIVMKREIKKEAPKEKAGEGKAGATKEEEQKGEAKEEKPATEGSDGVKK